jgi:DNA-binding transcriptional MerR regulator
MFKIGEVAKRTGVSIRSLRHYDSIELLSPSGRSESGYRLYSKSDLMQLQQIVSLKQMGFPLNTIKSMLNDDSLTLQKTMEMHMEYMQNELLKQQQIYRQIKHVCELMQTKQEVSIDEVCQTVESIKMLEKYYTEEQLEELKKRTFHLDEKKAKEYDDAWHAVFNGLAELEKQGVAASSPKTKPFALKSRELLSAFTQGDEGIEQSIKKMYEQEGGGQMLRNHGLDVSDDLYEYYSQALAAHIK